MRNKRKPATDAGWSFTLLGFFLASLICNVAEACPTCKDGIAEGLNHANVVRGYFWSIVFMMSMPFIIFGSMAAYLYSQVRKARQSTTVGTSDGDIALAAGGDTVQV